MKWAEKEFYQDYQLHLHLHVSCRKTAGKYDCADADE